MSLSAPDPDAWLATHLRARFEAGEHEVGMDGPLDLWTISDLVGDDATILRACHHRLTVEGTPAPAAATYLADWFAGIVAGAVGYGLAAAGAGFVLDAAEVPSQVRFHVHPDGWPLRVEFPAHAMVLPDHPWARGGSVHVVESIDEVLHRTVHALVRAVRPIIEACHRTARIGTVGLWNEVADSLGKAVAFQQLVAVTAEMVAVLDAAVATPGTPWKARPRLGFADSAVGPVHVAQKGGCCLAYTAAHDDDPTAGDDSLDLEFRAYLERFPIDPDLPRYCTTCSFRTTEDSNARQVFWAERRGEPSPTSSAG